MLSNNKDVVKTYNNLIKHQQMLNDKMSNLGREKDYKVQKIEKKYNSKIDDLIRLQNGIELEVEIAKRYVSDVEVENPVIKKRG
jgi:hypothetical protein